MRHSQFTINQLRLKGRNSILATNLRVISEQLKLGGADYERDVAGMLDFCVETLIEGDRRAALEAAA